mgnify:CR=1 FL=1
MKKYKLDYTIDARKALKKLDNSIKNRIIGWIEKNLEDCENPRQHGKALTGNLKGNWRYRVGDYRIIAKIEDEEILITVVDVNHRREVYR